MLKSELMKEKSRLAKQLTVFQEERDKIISQSKSSPENIQNKIREINQKILEVQEEIKAVDLKLY